MKMKKCPMKIFWNSEFLYIYESDDSVFDGAKYKKLCYLSKICTIIEGGEVNVDYNIEDVET